MLVFDAHIEKWRGLELEQQLVIENPRIEKDKKNPGILNLICKDDTKFSTSEIFNGGKLKRKVKELKKEVERLKKQFEVFERLFTERN